MHSGWWFMRRRFFKIYQNCPYFAPYWAPKGASLFICFLPTLVEIGLVILETIFF